MKKFKLLKDLPGVKAGAIFTEEKNQCFISDQYLQVRFAIGYALNSEWFEEIKEDKVEILVRKIHDLFYDTKQYSFDESLREYIKDNGKEEVIYQAYILPNKKSFEEFLKDYIIIKI